jgi:hypothetical protein
MIRRISSIMFCFLNAIAFSLFVGGEDIGYFLAGLLAINAVMFLIDWFSAIK